LAQGHAFPAVVFEVLEHVWDQRGNRLLMDIVGKSDTMARLPSLVHSILENFLGGLDVILVGPVLSVKVVVCNDVAEVLHDVLAIDVA
jgi:hypothetical protein